MRLHQILFHVRENCYRMLWNIKDSFWGTRTQSSQWKSPGSPRTKKARQVRSNIKSMLICFFDLKGIVQKEFFSPGQTDNATFYVEVLKRLWENMWRKRPVQWRNNTWLLQHDNAPAHAALLTRRFLTENNITVVPHSPYSPHLATSDYFVFQKLKMKFNGRRFQTLEEIQAESQAVLDTLQENDFQECFKYWQRRWDRCESSEGDYFELMPAPNVSDKPFCVLSQQSWNLLTTPRTCACYVVLALYVVSTAGVVSLHSNRWQLCSENVSASCYLCHLKYKDVI